MKDIKLEAVMIGVAVLLLFSLFDFTYCLITYGVITNQNSLSYKIFTALIPIFLVVSIVAKIIKWDESFEDILWSVYGPLLCWGLIMAFALPISLVFAGICNGIMLLDLFI
jgi:hypothetical protein